MPVNLAMEWYNQLSPDDQGKILDGYDKLITKFPGASGLISIPSWIDTVYHVTHNPKKMEKLGGKLLDKAGKMILKGRN